MTETETLPPRPAPTSMLRKLRDLASDSLLYGVSGFLGQLIGLLLLPIYTEKLDPADYGVLALLNLMTPVFITLASAGTKSAVSNQFYKSTDVAHRRVVTSTAGVSVALSTCLVLAISLAAAEGIADVLLGDVTKAGLVRLSLISAALTTLMEVPMVALQVTRQARIVGLLNVTQLVIVVACTVYLLVVAKWGVFAVIVSGIVGAAITLILAVLAAAKHFAWDIDRQVWREMSRYSLPFLPHRLQSTAMVFIGDYMIRQQLGLGDLGLYSIATRFGTPIVFLFGAFQQAWTPYKFKVFHEEANSKDFFRSILNYFVFVLAYLWLGISLWGPEALRLMTAPAFHTAAGLIWAVTLMRAAQAFYPIMSTGIDLAKDTRAVPLTSLAALVTVILGCWILVPAYGAFGAAFATTLAWLAMAAGFYIIGKRHLDVDYDWASVALLVVLAGLLVAAGQWMQSAALWLRLTTAVGFSLAYPPLALLIFLRSTSERPRVEILLSKLFGWRRSIFGLEREDVNRPLI